MPSTLDSRSVMARRALASLLETGALAGVWPKPFERALGALLARGIARPLDVPAGLSVITVGGATLGGSGKTRVATAVTRTLAEAGVNVVLVGHAYRAAPGSARVVPHDGDARLLLGTVGDEALASARELGVTARVVVGPSRQAALDHAVRLTRSPDVVVIDGPLQLAPRRARLALLAVDAEAPWGAGALPPAGDLRAPREALLAAADLVVPVDATPAEAILGERRVSLASLRDRRVGLFTALARPERLVRALARAGLEPATTVHVPDHGPLDDVTASRLRAAPVDLWLATTKCGAHLVAAGLERTLQIARIPAGCALPGELEARLRALCEPT